MNETKFYVIVKYDYVLGGYTAYAIEGLVFNTEEDAEEYRLKCLSEGISDCGIEELTLYKKEN